MYIPKAPLGALLLSTLLQLTSSSSLPTDVPSPDQIIINPPFSESTNRIPTSRESAILARRILHLTPLGTLSTIFPNSSSSLENRPSNLQNIPIGLIDYIADCEPTTNNPTILAISIATSFKNAISNPNISLSLSWTPQYPPKSRISYSGKPDPFAFSAANQPRFSILGYLETIIASPEEEQDLRKCFVDTHPDAKYWLPGNRIHHSEWMRLVVQEIYWVGGFGDRAYIGWIPIEEWRSVDKKEWEEARLVGEKKGWKEWAVEGLGLGGAWEL
ncbi:e538c51c-d097-49b1-b926-6fc996f5f3a9-CDS [Sclerotinia trifoliorum]|uniref:E538c51c-d097-49b1-b926-6fc996f5f3a9-CDS n=1 Tax=Sclerotinia trifoliorum TaxID=28548 RepID=A0A8H2ZPQ9_9HELO|nr:e538c51c-d097-49b1-b926-6fc996f5f3a9-CDS [Sclerotinia trifoliorum]